MKLGTKPFWIGTLVMLILSVVGCTSSPLGSYAVSGTVADAEGNPIVGVTLNFNGTRDFGTATTDAEGNWAKSGLSGEVTVTPVREGLSFDPEFTVVEAEAEGIDFEASGDFTAYLLYDAFSGATLNLSLWSISSGSPQVSDGQLVIQVPSTTRLWTEQSFSGDFTVDIEVAEFQKVPEGDGIMRNRMTFFLSDRDDTDIRLEFVRREDRVEIRYGEERDGGSVTAMENPFLITIEKQGPDFAFVIDGIELGPFPHPFGDSAVHFGLQTWSDSAGPVGSVYDRITIY